MNLYKTCIANLYSFLVIDATFASDDPSHFRNNFLERIKKLILTIDDKIRNNIYNMILTEKQQKYHHYHLKKMINMNILQVKKYYLLFKEE